MEMEMIECCGPKHGNTAAEMVIDMVDRMCCEIRHMPGDKQEACVLKMFGALGRVKSLDELAKKLVAMAKSEEPKKEEEEDKEDDEFMF